MAYDKLNKYLEHKGLKVKAEEGKAKKEAIIADFEAKDKFKKLTMTERIERLERLMGIEKELEYGN